MEIERRFLVTDIDKVEKLVEEYKHTKKGIIQDYIYSDIFTAIRKRKIVKDGKEKYIYTVKTGRKGFSVNEYENEISKEQYDSLKKVDNRITIIKDLKIELDIFHGVYEGIIFAEIEYENEKQAIETKIPEWFNMEIGKLVSNDMMSREKIDIIKLCNLK